MRSVGHCAIAATSWTGAVLVTHQPLPSALAGLTVAIGAGLAPDIDEPGSSMSRAYGYVGQFIAGILKMISGHRGGSHSILALVGVCVGSFYAAKYQYGRAALTFFMTYPALRALYVLRMRKVHKIIVAAGIAYLVATRTSAGWMPLAMGVGWAAHLAGDSLTPHGTPLAWPLTKKCVTLDWFKTGSLSESILTFALWAVFFIGGARYLQGISA